jgi:hypothetical protein
MEWTDELEAVLKLTRMYRHQLDERDSPLEALRDGPRYEPAQDHGFLDRLTESIGEKLEVSANGVLPRFRDAISFFAAEVATMVRRDAFDRRRWEDSVDGLAEISGDLVRDAIMVSLEECFALQVAFMVVLTVLA